MKVVTLIALMVASMISKAQKHNAFILEIGTDFLKGTNTLAADVAAGAHVGSMATLGVGGGVANFVDDDLTCFPLFAALALTPQLPNSKVKLMFIAQPGYNVYSNEISFNGRTYESSGGFYIHGAFGAVVKKAFVNVGYTNYSFKSVGPTGSSTSTSNGFAVRIGAFL